eukprot:3506771-Alexandrium_andersonii.AAC.1
MRRLRPPAVSTHVLPLLPALLPRSHERKERNGPAGARCSARDASLPAPGGADSHLEATRPLPSSAPIATRSNKAGKVVLPRAP